MLATKVLFWTRNVLLFFIIIHILITANIFSCLQCAKGQPVLTRESSSCHHRLAKNLKPIGNCYSMWYVLYVMCKAVETCQDTHKCWGRFPEMFLTCTILTCKEVLGIVCWSRWVTAASRLPLPYSQKQIVMSIQVILFIKWGRLTATNIPSKKIS